MAVHPCAAVPIMRPHLPPLDQFARRVRVPKSTESASWPRIPELHKTDSSRPRDIPGYFAGTSEGPASSRDCPAAAAAAPRCS